MDESAVLSFLLIFAGYAFAWRLYLIADARSAAAARRKLVYFNLGKPSRYFDKPYHAVAIHPQGETACPYAEGLRRKRFLAREAPLLPLSGCSVERCKCKYRHYADRRSGVDRRSDFFIPSAGKGISSERRSTSGRRAEDLLSVW